MVIRYSGLRNDSRTPSLTTSHLQILVHILNLLIHSPQLRPLQSSGLGLLASSPILFPMGNPRSHQWKELDVSRYQGSGSDSSLTALRTSWALELVEKKYYHHVKGKGRAHTTQTRPPHHPCHMLVFLEKEA